MDFMIHVGPFHLRIFCDSNLWFHTVQTYHLLHTVQWLGLSGLFCLSVVTPSEQVISSWMLDSPVKLLPPVVPSPTITTQNNLGVCLGPQIFRKCNVGIWKGKAVYYLAPVPGKDIKQMPFNHKGISNAFWGEFICAFSFLRTLKQHVSLVPFIA